MEAMTKSKFARKMIHQQYINKLEKRRKAKEYEEFIHDSKQVKYTYRIKHSRR